MIDITSGQFIIGWIIFAVVICPLQFVVAAPYGRHTSSKWGPLVNSKLGWVVMELVSLVAFGYAFWSAGSWSQVSLILAALFAAHYVHRSLIYPFMTRTGKKRMPLLIVLFAIGFNVVNGYINGDFLGAHGELYPTEYLTRWNSIAGLILFFVGAAINVWSDYYLISLRKTTEPGVYVIPSKGPFRWLSSPNLVGEMIEWIGFAVLCWSLPALAFAVWTITNLAPRAWHHHKWYRKQFPDYPTDRKVFIPGVV